MSRVSSQHSFVHVCLGETSPQWDNTFVLPFYYQKYVSVFLCYVLVDRFTGSFHDVDLPRM